MKTIGLPLHWVSWGPFTFSRSFLRYKDIEDLFDIDCTGTDKYQGLWLVLNCHEYNDLRDEDIISLLEHEGVDCRLKEVGKDVRFALEPLGSLIIDDGSGALIFGHEISPPRRPEHL